MQYVGERDFKLCSASFLFIILVFLTKIQISAEKTFRKLGHADPVPPSIVLLVFVRWFVRFFFPPRRRAHSIYCINRSS